MSKLDISIEKLFELGAHFGHRKRFWNPHMEDYIFCEKNNIHIIDLYKTQEKIAELYEAFRNQSSVGNKIMIVGTKRVASSYVTEFGEKTGMPYISHRWLGGMLTNWKTIKVPINKLLEYEENKASGELDSMIKKEAVMLEKEMKKLALNFDGVKDMKGLPDAIFVIDVENDELSYELILKGNNGVCSYLGDGLINYSPNPGYPTGQIDGKDICSFRANDGYGNSNESIINIIIRSENDFPVLSSINQPIQFKEDTISNPLFVQATDEDEDFLTFTCDQIIKQKNQVQNIFCNVDGSKIVFSATEHFNGTEFVRITVDDNYGGIDYQNVMVIVDQVYDPPQFRNLVSLEMNEENNSIFTINALDPDIEDSLSFSCLGLNKNIECKMNNNFVLKPDGSYDASFFLIPNTNFYGKAKIEVQVDDGYNDRYSIKDTILVEVLNIDDYPKIKPLVLNIDGNPLQIIDNQVSFNEIESDQEVKFVFEVSDPDSLGNPDELSVSSEPLGLYFSDGEFRQNLDIDLQSVCPIAECTSDFDDDSNVICTLECDNNFSGNFVQRFIVKDSDDLQDTVEVNINIKQVNDPPYSNIVLKDSLSTYSKNIDIKSLEGPIINEKIFFDQTKFYQDSVLTNPNPIPLNPDLDSLYYYYDYINESVPSYYFIWKREQNPSYFDPDTDPELNQYPYNLYYRLELINGTDVFVVDDYIDDSIFNGIYAYTLADIKSDSLYPMYNIDELYIPSRDYDNMVFAKDGGIWQGQLHIYQMPFYYIDYTLAQTCAFQFWIKNEKDSDSAWIDYLRLCKAGGSLSFVDLVKLAGLNSPFEDGCLEDVVKYVDRWLKGFDIENI